MENTVAMVFGMFAGCVVGMATTLSWQCFKAYKKETDIRFEKAKKEILSLKERQDEHSERIGRTEDKIYDLETEFKVSACRKSLPKGRLFLVSMV